MDAADHDERRFRDAVRRAYAAAGLRLAPVHERSLARVYAGWAESADPEFIADLERALAASLMLPAS